MKINNAVLIKYRGRYGYGEDIVAVAVDIKTAIMYSAELKEKYPDAYGSGEFFFNGIDLVK